MALRSIKWPSDPQTPQTGPQTLQTGLHTPQTNPRTVQTGPQGCPFVGQIDGTKGRWMNKKANFSPFYKTLSPIKVAVLLPLEIKKYQINLYQSPRDVSHRFYSRFGHHEKWTTIFTKLFPMQVSNEKKVCKVFL